MIWVFSLDECEQIYLEAKCYHLVDFLKNQTSIILTFISGLHVLSILERKKNVGDYGMLQKQLLFSEVKKNTFFCSNLKSSCVW